MYYRGRSWWFWKLEVGLGEFEDEEEDGRDVKREKFKRREVCMKRPAVDHWLKLFLDTEVKVYFNYQCFS